MSYETIEAGILTVIRLLSGYSSTNTSRGDGRILNAGITKAIILTPSGVPERNISASPRVVRILWETSLDLFIAWSDGAEFSDFWSNIISTRDALVAHLDKYPTMNSVAGIIHSFVISIGATEMQRGENRQWAIVPIVIHTEERQVITIAE